MCRSSQNMSILKVIFICSLKIEFGYLLKDILFNFIILPSTQEQFLTNIESSTNASLPLHCTTINCVCVCVCQSVRVCVRWCVQVYDGCLCSICVCCWWVKPWNRSSWRCAEETAASWEIIHTSTSTVSTSLAPQRAINKWVIEF